MITPQQKRKSPVKSLATIGGALHSLLGFLFAVSSMQEEIKDLCSISPLDNLHNLPYDDWIFRQLADIDNRKNIPNTSPQVDFNKGDYEDYLKAKWNRGL